MAHRQKHTHHDTPDVVVEEEVIEEITSTSPLEESRKQKGKRFAWATKKTVITIVLVYLVIMVAAFLWTTFVSGWDNDFWMLWLW